MSTFNSTMGSRITMANIKRFFRLDYRNDSVLEDMVSTGTVSCPDQDFAMKLQAGDGILLARFDEGSRTGEVCAIGRVTTAPGSSAAHRVDWVRVSLSLAPSSQGMKFWRQAKPWFVFAKSVIPRYRLPQLFAKHFSGTGSPEPRSQGAVDKGQPAPDAPPNAALGGLQEQCVAGLCPPNDRSGYVYLIHSEYGYKIGKTKRMKERSQLFTVKLPFEIEVVHYAWHGDYSAAEAALHRRFRDRRLGGEWFQLTPSDVRSIKEFRL